MIMKIIIITPTKCIMMYNIKKKAFEGGYKKKIINEINEQIVYYVNIATIRNEVVSLNVKSLDSL